MATVAQLILRRPWWVVIAWLCIFALSVPAAQKLDEHIGNGGYQVPGSEASQVSHLIAATPNSAETLVYLAMEADPPDRLSSQVGVAEQVLRTEGVMSAGATRYKSSKGIALLPLSIPMEIGATQKRLPVLADNLRKVLRPATNAAFFGEPATISHFSELARSDLEKAEKLSLPITLAILVIAFLSAVAAGLPIILALVCVTTTFAALSGIALLLDVNVFVRNIVSLLGLAISIDYSLFMVARYRDYLQHHDNRERRRALQQTIMTTGRAIAVSAITIAVSLASLLVFGIGIFTSMAIGATLAAVIAGLAAITLVPAIILLLGRHIDRLSIQRAVRASQRARLWRYLGRLVSRRPLVIVLGTTAILLLCAVPVSSLKLDFRTTTSLPPGDSVRLGTERIGQEFGDGVMSPISVLTTANTTQVQAVLRSDPDIAEVLPAARARGRWQHLMAIGRTEENTPAAEATIRRLRDRFRASNFKSTLVGGQTAAGIDLTDRISERLPLMVLAAIALGFLLLVTAFKAWVVAVKAVLINLLTVSAALGLTILIFTGGNQPDSLTYFVPVFLFAIAFGLSMDYEIFLLSRVNEEYRKTLNNDLAVTRGLVASGRAITLAAIVMITVFLSSLTSSLEPFKQVGVGMALAVAIDAFIVRSLLVPAALILLGKRNWVGIPIGYSRRSARKATDARAVDHT